MGGSVTATIVFAVSVPFVALLAWLFVRRHAAERRIVQENALALSTLDVDTSVMLTAAQLAPALEKLLDRLMLSIRVKRAFIVIAKEWRGTLPSVQRGFDDALWPALQAEGVGDALCEMAYRRGGIATVRRLRGMLEPVFVAKVDVSEPIKRAFAGKNTNSFTAVSLQTRTKNLGVLVFPHSDGRKFDTAQMRIMLALTMQVATTLDNYMLMLETQRHASHLAFLNNVSKTAISSQHAEQMLAGIVAEIQKNFHFDHIGIGILDYATKEIEIKAEAGETAKAIGRRIAIGFGIAGRVARSNALTLVQGIQGPVMGILPESRSVLCLPLTYGETLLGILNIESAKENAFAEEDVLLMRTLADLLTTALHNALVFQKMQHQSITDALTGVKTRRYFLEALASEWKRASRSGRPFSVVLVDLDKFKDVNDGLGHLEGDLVLARVGRLLEQKCRHSNVVARYGGDEFVILMPETGVEQAQILSERLRLWIATDPMLNERHVTGSFGVASFPLHGSSVEDIVRVADAGMYVSKHAGGNRVSTAENVVEDETIALQRQHVQAYVEGFLRREKTGPEYVDELVDTLRRMCTANGQPVKPELVMDAVCALARAAEAREANMARHGEKVGKFAKIIAQGLAISDDEVEALRFAGTVHDVGKLLVPDSILDRAGVLKPAEYELIKMHASLGAQIVGSIPGCEAAQVAIRHHHERLNGGGYPDQLRAEQIPLGAKILAVADAYVTMTTDTSFMAARKPLAAVRELEEQAGLLYDRGAVEVLAAHVRDERFSEAHA